MKYISEYRDGALARQIAGHIAREANPDRAYSFMEFCGGHTHAISRYGLTDLLPGNVKMIHGPGCPVCVLPIGRIDQVIALALQHGVIVATYADTMRVPASGGQSLMKAKALGADIRMVYSVRDALTIARDNPAREVVFFAIGFETTTPPTALALQTVRREALENFSVLSCHVLTPPAIAHILDSPEVRDWKTVPLDGFVGPAHVSILIGSRPYEAFAAQYRKPVVISGFEPLDVMQSILMLVRQVNDGRSVVENEFIRAVTRDGNAKAQATVADVFALRDSFEWRGLGDVPNSGLRIRPEYSAWNAEVRFPLPYVKVPDHPQCQCGPILRGLKRPTDCKLFASVCTPENPLGACMVSSEGACAAHYSYGRFRDIGIVTP